MFNLKELYQIQLLNLFKTCSISFLFDFLKEQSFTIILVIKEYLRFYLLILNSKLRKK